MKLSRISINDIETGGRVRPLSKTRRDILARSIAERGLQTPIAIRPQRGGAKPYRLISGLHRMEAYREVTPAVEATIAAIIHEVSAEEARLMEIDENLANPDTFPLDKAAILVQRQKLWIAEHGAQRGGDRKSAEANRKSKVYSGDFDFSKEKQAVRPKNLKDASVSLCNVWGKEVLEAVGLSRASVFRLLFIHSHFDPENTSALYKCDPKIYLSITQLYALTKQPPLMQRRVLDQCRRGGIKTISAGLAAVAGNPPPRTDRLERFKTLFHSMTPKEQGQALRWLKVQQRWADEEPRVRPMAVVEDGAG